MLITLAGKIINPCDACISYREVGKCHINYGFHSIFEMMLNADSIMLATQVISGSASPQIKALIDRLGYFLCDRFENKVGDPL